jgi:Carboxypeptidase regulatory-like domain
MRKDRNRASEFIAACVTGLFILSASSAAADLGNSPGCLKQSSRTLEDLVISGIVLDPSNAAIAGANVTLHGGSLVNEPSTVTDLTGHFQFAGVPPGSYEVEVQREGFKIMEKGCLVSRRESEPFVELAYSFSWSGEPDEQAQ